MTPERERKLMDAKGALAGLMKDQCDALGLTSSEVLALTAYMTGIAIANQDQRAMTPSQAMEVVSRNIEAGNAAAMKGLLSADTSVPQ